MQKCARRTLPSMDRCTKAATAAAAGLSAAEARKACRAARRATAAAQLQLAARRSCECEEKPMKAPPSSLSAASAISYCATSPAAVVLTVLPSGTQCLDRVYTWLETAGATILHSSRCRYPRRYLSFSPSWRSTTARTGSSRTAGTRSSRFRTGRPPARTLAAVEARSASATQTASRKPSSSTPRLRRRCGAPGHTIRSSSRARLRQPGQQLHPPDRRARRGDARALPRGRRSLAGGWRATTRTRTRAPARCSTRRRSSGSTRARARRARTARRRRLSRGVVALHVVAAGAAAAARARLVPRPRARRV